MANIWTLHRKRYENGKMLNINQSPETLKLTSKRTKIKEIVNSKCWQSWQLPRTHRFKGWGWETMKGLRQSQGLTEKGMGKFSNRVGVWITNVYAFIKTQLMYT